MSEAPVGDAAPRVLVLQHPREAEHPLGTVPLLQENLEGVKVRVGLSWPNLRKALGVKDARPSEWLVLHVGTKKDTERAFDGCVPRKGLILLSRKGKAAGDAEQVFSSLRGLIVLDGNWKQAKTLWWRNPWLLKLRRALYIPEGVSVYGRIRREPRRDCLSTFEAVVHSTAALGWTADAEPLVQLLKSYLETGIPDHEQP